MPNAEPSTLAALISAALPTSAPPLRIHHVWHTPSKSDALYSPPKNKAPESTTLSSHFLAVSLPAPHSPANKKKPVLVFGIEVLIYSTSNKTTLFVSKADSTGFLQSGGAKDGTKRPITSIVRTITTVFMKYLTDRAVKKSGGRTATTHVSLFARAQDQYIFPNSIKNKDKHVLSDRQLIRWWARCLDPLLQSFDEKADAKGYLLVPGLDKYECRPLFPPGQKRWVHGHPYSSLEKPVRECIPHFPDDPKSRFMMENEVDEGVGWRGVTMESFWELMSFRQECSLGKSVGFLSVVVPPKAAATTTASQQLSAAAASSEVADSSQPSTVEGGSQDPNSQVQTDSQTTAASQASQASAKSDDSRREKRNGRQMSTYTGASLLKNPERLKRFPRGRLIRSKSSSLADVSASAASTGGALSKKEYDRLLESLLNSDFGGRKYAEDSSSRWIDVAGGEDVVGTKPEEEQSQAATTLQSAAGVNVLTVVRKRPVEDAANGASSASPAIAVNVLPVRKKSKVSLTENAENGTASTATAAPVNDLSSMVRKKPKPEGSTAAPALTDSTPPVNTLSTSLVRKKPKPEEAPAVASAEKKEKETETEKVAEQAVTVVTAEEIPAE